MKQLNLEEVVNYIETNIGEFHRKKIESLNDLKLLKILKRKNPYLFRAKYLLSSHDIVKSLTDAYISSNEETIFGDWLEKLAIFVNSIVFDGKKSSATGIDLEFDFEGKRFIVAIKSGPNWGNNGQVKKLIEDFTKAAKTLRTSNSGLNVVAVNGCCYGRDNKPDKGTYYKYCGQRFWQFISGNEQLYVDLIKPLGKKAKENREEYDILYGNTISVFGHEFFENFCDPNGSVNWEKLVKFNSGL